MNLAVTSLLTGRHKDQLESRRTELDAIEALLNRDYWGEDYSKKTYMIRREMYLKLRAAVADSWSRLANKVSLPSEHLETADSFIVFGKNLQFYFDILRALLDESKYSDSFYPWLISDLRNDIRIL